jgi:hypothetical protein
VGQQGDILHKLTAHLAGEEQPVNWPRVYRREQTTGPDRLAVAVGDGAVDLLLDLASYLGPELWVLYVLTVPRGPEPAGRYQSPLLGLPDLVCNVRMAVNIDSGLG